MTPDERRFWLRVQRRASQLEPDLARELLRSLREIRETLSDSGFEALIRSGNIDQILRERLSDAALDPSLAGFRAQLQETLRESMRLMARDVPSLITRTTRQPDVLFDVLNSNVVEAARTLDTRVMSDVRDSIRETVRQEIRSGLERGINPRQIAREVPDLVGLSPRSAQAVRNFRAELVAGDRSALRRVLRKGRVIRPDGTALRRSTHAGGKGLTQGQWETLRAKLGAEPLTDRQVDAMVEAYRQRLLAWETEAITRSAALDALRGGNRLNWERAIELGTVDRERLMKERLVVDDGRERPEHARLRGQSVHFDASYDNGEVVAGDSSHGCRCADRYFVVASIEDVARITEETRTALAA